MERKELWNRIFQIKGDVTLHLRARTDRRINISRILRSVTPLFFKLHPLQFPVKSLCDGHKISSNQGKRRKCASWLHPTRFGVAYGGITSGVVRWRIRLQTIQLWAWLTMTSHTLLVLEVFNEFVFRCIMKLPWCSSKRHVTFSFVRSFESPLMLKDRYGLAAYRRCRSVTAKMWPTHSKEWEGPYGVLRNSGPFISGSGLGQTLRRSKAAHTNWLQDPKNCITTITAKHFQLKDLGPKEKEK